MSENPRSLTDELNSVLRSHSLNAPEPQATIDEILTRITSGPEATSVRRWRRLKSVISVNNVVVAAAVIVGAGLTGWAIHANGPSTSAAKSATAAYGVATPAPAAAGSPAAGDSLAASAPIASGVCNERPAQPVTEAVIGASTYDIVQSDCSGADGDQVFVRQHDGRQLVASLIEPAQRFRVDYLSVRANRIIIRVFYLGDARAVGSVNFATAGSVSDLTFGGPNFGLQSREPIAASCLKSDLAVTVSALPVTSGSLSFAAAAAISVVNKSVTPCALSGYPHVIASDAKNSTVAASPTLAGSRYGVFDSSRPPVIVLAPAGTATAVVESGIPASTHNQSCPAATSSSISLPGIRSIASSKVPLAMCGLQVHPLVYGITGRSG